MQNALLKSLSLLSILFFLGQLAAPTIGLAQSHSSEDSSTTVLKIQVRSLDAKFIGSGVGELNVQATDVATGRVLDHGRVTGTTNQFAGGMDHPDSGEYMLYVIAHQRSTANTGVQQRHLKLP